MLCQSRFQLGPKLEVFVNSPVISSSWLFLLYHKALSIFFLSCAIFYGFHSKVTYILRRQWWKPATKGDSALEWLETVKQKVMEKFVPKGKGQKWSGFGYFFHALCKKQLHISTIKSVISDCKGSLTGLCFNLWLHESFTVLNVWCCNLWKLYFMVLGICSMMLCNCCNFFFSIYFTFFFSIKAATFFWTDILIIAGTIPLLCFDVHSFVEFVELDIYKNVIISKLYC